MDFNIRSKGYQPHITRDVQGYVEGCTLQGYRRYWFHFNVIEKFISKGITCSDVIEYCDNTLFLYTNKHFDSNYKHKSIEEINNMRKQISLDDKYHLTEKETYIEGHIYGLERVRLPFLLHEEIYNMYCKQNFTPSKQSLY